jgi:hypothetical protein
MRLVAREDSVADFNNPWSLVRWYLVTSRVSVGHRDICLCHQDMMTSGFRSELKSWVVKRSLLRNVFNY